MKADLMITKTVERILAERSSPDVVRESERTGLMPPSLWEPLFDGGFTLVGLPEAAGGGGTASDAAEMLRLVGRYASPIPLAEATMLGGWVLAGSGLDIPDATITAAPPHPEGGVTLRSVAGGLVAEGNLSRVPWGAEAKHVVALVDGPDGLMAAVLDTQSATVTDGRNLAGEPRAELAFEGVRVRADQVARAGLGIDLPTFRARGALTRALMMAGALERVLELTINYAETRQQFGRPLNRFQAVAQNLAILAEQSIQARMAAEIGVLALDRRGAIYDAAVAKVVSGLAATEGARLAHQIHGAMGVTSDYEMQLLTRRLWAWRDEYGNERAWSVVAGESVLALDGDAAWTVCTGAPGELPVSTSPVASL